MKNKNEVRPAISVVIITKNQQQLVLKTLQSLKNQTTKNIQIIIVDSGSTPSTLNKYKNYDVEIINIPSSNFNYSDAINLGVKHAQAEIVLRLSGDAIPIETNFISKILSHFKDPKIAGVNTRWQYSDKMVIEYKIPLMYYQNFQSPKLIKSPFPPNGACIALRRDLCTAHPFSNKYIYGEDFEWEFWALSNQYKFIYDPTISVFHEHISKQSLPEPKVVISSIHMLLMLISSFPIKTATYCIIIIKFALKYLFTHNNQK